MLQSADDLRVAARQEFDEATGRQGSRVEWTRIHHAAQALYEATPAGERAALIAAMAAQIEAMIAQAYPPGTSAAPWGREALPGWLEAAASGEDHALLALTSVWSFAHKGDKARIGLLPAVLARADLRGLQVLYLFGNGSALTDEVWAALCAAKGLSGLRQLSLLDCKIEDRHIASLLEATGDLWEGLRTLHLHNALCTVESARLIASSPRAGVLESLDFGYGSKVGWEGRVLLASSPHLSAAVRKAQNLGAVRLAQEPGDLGEDSARFGEVRSALQGEPGEAAWCQLTHALSAASAQDMAERLGAYVEGGLRGWPDGARLAPEAWVDEVLAGKPAHPALSLSRAVVLRGEHLNGTRYLNAKLAARLAASPLWAGVREVALEQVETTKKSLAGLLWPAEHAGLRSIRVDAGGSAGAQVAIEALEAAPAGRLEGLEALALRNTTLDRALVGRLCALLEGERLSGIKRLSLKSFHVGDMVAEALTRAPWFVGVTHLSLTVGDQHMTRVLDALARARCLVELSLIASDAPQLDEALGRRLGEVLALSAGTLASLDLSGFYATSAGLAALCEAGQLTRLERLVLCADAHQGAAQLEALLDGAALPALRALVVRHVSFMTRDDLDQPLPTWSLARWASAPVWGQLERLELEDANLRDGALREVKAALPRSLALVRSWRGEGLWRELGEREELEALEVAGRGLRVARAPEAGCWPKLRALKVELDEEETAAPGWFEALECAAPALTSLHLNRLTVGDAGAEGLWASGLHRRLEALHLERCGMRQPGALELVARLGEMARLRELGLVHGSYGPKVAQALAATPALAELHRLDLTGNRMGFEGRQALISSPHLPVMLWTRVF